MRGHPTVCASQHCTHEPHTRVVAMFVVAHGRSPLGWSVPNGTLPPKYEKWRDPVSRTFGETGNPGFVLMIVRDMTRTH